MPTEKKEAEVTGLGINCFFQQQFGLCGKLHSYRYLCKDELVIMCALGPLSMSPLEDVVPCLRGAAPYLSFHLLILIAELALWSTFQKHVMPR